MRSYKVLVTSLLGSQGDIVQLEETTQTQERLEKGIIAEIKVEIPTEKKTTKKKAKYKNTLPNLV